MGYYALLVCMLVSGTAWSQTTTSSTVKPPAAVPVPAAAPVPVPVPVKVSKPPPPVKVTPKKAAASRDAGVRKLRVPRRRRGRNRPLPVRIRRDSGVAVAKPPAPALDAGVAALPQAAQIRGARPLPLKGEDSPQTGTMGDWLLWVLMIAAVLAGRTADLLARYMKSHGILGGLLRISALGARASGLLLAVALLSRQGFWAGPRVLWGVLALFGLSAWAGRNVLADLFAHLVLRMEGRVRAGKRVETDLVSGRVQGLGLRATEIIDPAGRSVYVPNHLMLHGPMRADPELWPTREVELRLHHRDAVVQRQVLVDAVRASPWVPINGQISVHRDPMDPDLWRVRAQVLEASYAENFAGELSEQVEARMGRASLPREGDEARDATGDRTGQKNGTQDAVG
jgi:hypothetical protein